jgi:hypothetical protein
MLFDRLGACLGLDPGTNGIRLILFVVSLSNHERNHLIRSEIPKPSRLG